MKLGNYEWNPETDLINEGAFAEVFKAKDINSGNRIIALKIYKESLAKGTTGSSNQKKYSLEGEFEKIIDLSHTNLIKFYNLDYIRFTDAMGRPASHPVIAMEYASEGTLIDYKKTNPTTEDLKKVLADVLKGVQYLHEEMVIHRDLKPGNVLISRTRSGKPLAKITDFGISKDVLSGKTIEQSYTEGVGTPHYMAPEQFAKKKYGLDSELSYRTDIWGIGIIFYWTYTGKLPFGNRSKDFELIRDSILADEPDLSVVNNPAVKSAIEGCLKKHAKDRFTSYREILKVLNGDEVVTSASPREPVPTTLGNRTTVVSPETPTYITPEIISQDGQTEMESTGLGNKKPIEVRRKKNKSAPYIIAAVILLMAISGYFIFDNYQKKQYAQNIKIANQHHSGAMYDSAVFYYKKALNHYEVDSTKKRLNGLTKLKSGLADFYDANYEISIRNFKDVISTDAKIADAYYYLGELAYNGLGMSQNDSLGVTYTEKAVDLGFEMGYWRIAQNYQDGKAFILPSQDLADEYFLKAINPLKTMAENGDPEAQGNLGYMYDSGTGVPKNTNIAMKWYKKAAKSGYAFV